MIFSSAIMFVLKGDPGYPMVMTGKRHPDILEKMFNLHLDYDKESAVQGFMTDKGAFLNRYDAKYEAQKCNQLVEPTDYRELYSEDIWPE